MTREEKKQRRRQNLLMAICWFIVLVWVACLLSTRANAAFDGEAYKTGLSAIGGVTVSAAIMRVIVWLDTPKKRGR